MAEDTSYQPGVYRLQGGNSLVIETNDAGRLFLDKEQAVAVIVKAGSPTNGGSGTGAGYAGPGSLCIDKTGAVLYINTNTAASPTWTVVGNQS